MGPDVKRDALGRIFKIEKQLGRGDEFEIISHFSDGGLRVARFHHEECDGFGALLKESRAWSGAELVIPLFRWKARTQVSRRISGVLGFLSDVLPSKTRWKHLDETSVYSPRHLAWMVLSRESTQQLIQSARSRKVSLNSLLMFVFNDVIARVLLNDRETRLRWLFPVNMRMNIAEANSTANHTSSIGLSFARADSIERIDASLKLALNPWRALLTHRLAHLVARLTDRALIWLAKKRGTTNFWIGSFSNLGVWNFPAADAEPRWPIALSIAPPAGSPCFPVGVGVITWQGHLSVSLRLHPALVRGDEPLSDEILTAVSERLSQLVSQQLTFERSSIRGFGRSSKTSASPHL